MSATNTTTNYSLPIFIETDKPAWLVDFNGAMRAIDAQMKTNADAIATKSPILTFNDTAEIDFTKSGDIITANLASGVSDKVGRALVTPISAPASEQLVGIDTNGNQAAVEIGSGLFNDNGTLKAIDLNLTDTGVSNTTVSPSVSGSAPVISYAFNEEHTVGKIYGRLDVRGAQAGTTYTFTLTDIKAAATGESYEIWPAAHKTYNNNDVTAILHFDADGTIKIILTVPNGTFNMYFLPYLIFFKNFGDEPLTP